MEKLLTSGALAVPPSMSALHLSSRMLAPGTSAALQISIKGMRCPHPNQLIKDRSWRRMGDVCPQRMAVTAAVQGARVAGSGDYDVTDTKFFTRLGPPSCSPPV
ncbi:MAG: hypothetical protein ACRDPL_12650 [Propionibacteriaceae bacterium]